MMTADTSPQSDATDRKVHSARRGHAKRRFLQGEPLTGELLTFALDLVADDAISAKLRAGQELIDYEMHLMLDAYLQHARLGLR